jgi:hypothetical protein
MSLADAPSLTRQVAAVPAASHVVACAWLKDTTAFALADGTVLLAKGGETHPVAAHPDAGILVAVGDGARLVTGGDDGRVAVTGPDGSTRTFAETGGAWVDALALHPGGAVAWSAGKRVAARDDKGRERTFDAPSTPPRPSFAPRATGWRIAHYGGATLWFPNLDTGARTPRLEGLPPRRDLVAGRPLRRHLHAGEFPARLAAPARPGAHADERLSLENALRCPGRETGPGSRPRAPTPW